LGRLISGCFCGFRLSNALRLLPSYPRSFFLFCGKPFSFPPLLKVAFGLLTG